MRALDLQREIMNWDSSNKSLLEFSALLRNEVHYQNEIEHSFRIISTAKEGPQLSHLDHDLKINDISLHYTYFLGA